MASSRIPGPKTEMIWPGATGPGVPAGEARREPGQHVVRHHGAVVHHEHAAVGVLVTMAATAISGWMYTLDAFWGVEWVEALHEGMANAMLALVLIHVAGVVVESMRHGENLVRAMINRRGRGKPVQL